MKKSILIPIMVILAIISSFYGNSQEFTLNALKKQMVSDWKRAKSYTLEYLNAMPEEKYNFKPVDSVQTFAQQMIHLAVTDMFLVFIASGKKPPAFTWSINIGETAASQTKDSVLYYVSTSYDYCIKTITALNPATWAQKKVVSKKQKTRFELLENAFEHQTHHRGQTTIYLRLQGIRPPEANLF